jgi:catechol 2,3-dioxygenase-like lactoylglutathione lyase family enzyme
MTKHITTGAVHHLTLTVTDVERARTFYTELLGFQQIAEYGPRAVLSNGNVLLVVGPAPNPDQAIRNDSFDENRIGLDHVSLSANSRADLEAAIRLFDEQGISHGEIKDLEPFGICVLAFRDPDNIQIELTAPYS